MIADSEKYFDKGHVDLIYRPSTGEIASKDESITTLKSYPAKIGEISVLLLFLLLEKIFKPGNMKHLFTFTVAVFCLIGMMQAQVITTSQPLNKNAVLEEYTGIHCQYCPQGHAIAKSILENNPGRAAVISIHQGSFASPSAGEPDYRTPFGDPLAGQTALTGYPSGTVNRHVFTGTTTALGRGDWTANANVIMQQPSPVNVGVETTVDTVTRQLTVHVELFYTANSAVPTNYINVALIQSHIFGPQTGGNAGNNYEHMEMLRHLVTGQWGDAVTPTTQGTLIDRTYTYTIPAAYNNIPCVIKNCDVVVFVTESHQEILTGDVVPAIDGTNLYVGDITTTGPLMKTGQPSNETTFDLVANSNIAGPHPFKIKMTSDAPTGWQPEFTVDGQSYSDSAIITLTKGTPKPVTVEIMCGYEPAFSEFNFEISSVNNANAPSRHFKVNVISNVHTLLVNAAGDENAVLHQDVYINGLTAAGCDHLAVMMSDDFVAAKNAGVLTEIINVFYNCAWTFPAFTDPEAIAAQSFVENGKNLFVAGQDIGWDIMSGQSGSHGTPATQNLYTNILKATYVDDGSSANNKLVANTTDPIYGTVVTSNIVDVYAGNMYPDQITPRDNASATFYYNTTMTKIGAIRSTTNQAKVVYFGVGFEMIQTEAVRNDILNRTYDWFMETVSTQEITASSGQILGAVIPNPADWRTTIQLNNATDGMALQVTDLAGQTISSQRIGHGMTSIKLETQQIKSGSYLLNLVNHGRSVEVKKLVIQH
jgi:hypothetical protein